jgi:hypothetical protein
MPVRIAFCIFILIAASASISFASQIERSGPGLPVPPRPTIVASQWNDLIIKALDGDAASATTIGRIYAHKPGTVEDVPEAIRWLSRGADLGSNEARRELGLLLLRGEGTLKDPDHAASLLNQAAEAGDPEAEATLGVMYAFGEGFPQNWSLAVDWSRKAADHGDPTGQSNLGLYLEIGRAGEPDPAQAAIWYRRAADKGLGLAEARLGLLYQNGTGVSKDPAQAFALYLRGALNNDPVSQRLLALAFRDGVGVDADPDEVIAWLTRSAQNGDPGSMYLLADAYEQGRDVTRNPGKSWRYLLDAAEQGHVLSAARVGIAYAIGANGLSADHEAAAHWLNVAIERATKEQAFAEDDLNSYRTQQLSLAHFQLGMLLLNGDGIQQDVVRAVQLFQYASTLHCPSATNQLAQMYRAGVGVPRDDAKAVSLFESAANAGLAVAAFNLAEGSPAKTALPWYRRAAALGYPPAWLALAKAYEEGNGVAQDNFEALTWYQLAGNNGVQNAQSRLGDIARFGKLGQPRNDEVALQWYRLAAENGSVAAEEKIGDLYWLGSSSIQKDSAEAVRHYRVAANQGSASAQRKIAWAYANADGVPSDDTQMLFWARRAAEGGDAEAAAIVGYAIMIGLDGTYDLVEAATWLTLAADSVHGGAWRDRAAAYSRDASAKLTQIEQAAYRARLGRWRSTLVGE